MSITFEQVWEYSTISSFFVIRVMWNKWKSLFIYFLFFVGVDRPFSSWQWTRTHRSEYDLGGVACGNCPHSRLFERVESENSFTPARQPYNDPIILGGGPRLPGPPGVVQSGSWLVVCRVHPSGCPPVLPTRMVRVRGDPPSSFISRPYLRFPGSDPASSRGLNGVSLYSPRLDESRDALSYLLSNVEIVFESYERCLDELDAWRRYYHSGC